jgi:hypothetical protein
MSEANTRGEVTIDLDARYAMRPSFEAIEAIEEQTGKSVLALLVASERGNLLSKEVYVIVCEFIKAWAKERIASGENTPETRNAAGSNVGRIGDLVYKSGLLNAQLRLRIVLGAAVTGGTIPTGEDEATATETETPAVA